MNVSVKDVAAYILEKQGEMTTMKLQKLVYYCQAWSLVWDDESLFNEEIEAWANGPIVKKLYDVHKRQYKIRKLTKGDSEKLSELQKTSIEHVLSYYGDKSSQWLSDLTHVEDPWKNQRIGLAPGERSNNIITIASMSEYYSSL